MTHANKLIGRACTGNGVSTSHFHYLQILQRFDSLQQKKNGVLFHSLSEQRVWEIKMAWRITSSDMWKYLHIEFKNIELSIQNFLDL